MNDETILNTLRQAIADECDNPKVTVTTSTRAIDVPGWDSLAHVRIIMNVEARLGITVDIEKTYRAATIGDLVEILRMK